MDPELKAAHDLVMHALRGMAAGEPGARARFMTARAAYNATIAALIISSKLIERNKENDRVQG